MAYINQRCSLGYQLGLIAGMASTMEILAQKHVTGVGDETRVTGLVIAPEEFRILVAEIQSASRMYLDQLSQGEGSAANKPSAPNIDPEAYESLKKEAEYYRSEKNALAKRLASIEKVLTVSELLGGKG